VLGASPGSMPLFLASSVIDFRNSSAKPDSAMARLILALILGVTVSNPVSLIFVNNKPDVTDDFCDV